jgi:N-acetylglucosaminyl-diphospho-decaprenol L-rhamnosyltransferase
MLSPVAEFVQRVRGRLARSGRPWARRYVDRLVSAERTVDWVSGACLLLRRAEAREAGLFDERYFMYEEDVDLCAALRQRGGRILFTPRAVVVHARGASIARTGQPATAVYDRSHLAFYEKHRPGWAPLLRGWQRLRGRAIR